MIHIISSTLIYRPIKRVFDFISMPENDFQWQYGTLTSTRLSEGIIGLGACFQSVSHFMEYRIQSTLEVTEYEPNQKYGFKSTSGPLQSFTTYTLEIIKGCTKITISRQASAVNLIGLNENALEKKMKRQLKENLAMLKNILETG
ncbi:MAG: SRPBCC family protein [Anaerolineae bacterium]|nr:SRPBCC family protein [Anaerolineae bacterium]MCI0608520.1 SRPBCC family protein [Anaerolineae bacterium]